MDRPLDRFRRRGLRLPLRDRRPPLDGPPRPPILGPLRRSSSLSSRGGRAGLLLVGPSPLPPNPLRPGPVGGPPLQFAPLRTSRAFVPAVGVTGDVTHGICRAEPASLPPKPPFPGAEGPPIAPRIPKPPGVPEPKDVEAGGRPLAADVLGKRTDTAR